VNCPGCGAPDAYVGLSEVECWSNLCRHYSEPRARELGKIPVRYEPPTAAMIAALVKALEGGNYNAPPTQLTQGCTLQVEDLRDSEFHEFITLPPIEFINITFQIKDIVPHTERSAFENHDTFAAEVDGYDEEDEDFEEP
jgi:hypothetical protein